MDKMDKTSHFTYKKLMILKLAQSDIRDISHSKNAVESTKLHLDLLSVFRIQLHGDDVQQHKALGHWFTNPSYIPKIDRIHNTWRSHQAHCEQWWFNRLKCFCLPLGWTKSFESHVLNADVLDGLILPVHRLRFCKEMPINVE